MKENECPLGNQIASPRIFANSKNIGKAIKKRKPVAVNGGIVSTAILTASHVIAQAKQTMTNKINKTVLVVYQIGFSLFSCGDTLDIDVLAIEIESNNPRF